MIHLGKTIGKVTAAVTAVATAGVFGVFAYNYKDVGKHVRITETEVIKYWLDAEATDKNHQYYDYYQNAIKEHGDINLDYQSSDNATLNETRRKVFWDVRGKWSLWKPIHKKTTWYSTKLFINPWRCNNVVAPYKPSWEDKRNDGVNNGKLILWGHNPRDCLMVLEGNHRWEYFYMGRWFPFFCNVVVGYSPSWYHPIHEKTFNCGICKIRRMDEEKKQE